MIIDLLFRFSQVERKIEEWVEEKVVKHSDTKYVSGSCTTKQLCLPRFTNNGMTHVSKKVKPKLLSARCYTISWVYNLANAKTAVAECIANVSNSSQCQSLGFSCAQLTSLHLALAITPARICHSLHWQMCYLQLCCK